MRVKFGIEEGNINAPQGVSLARFSQICRVCTPFQDALAVKIWLDLLEGLWSYGGFKVGAFGYPKFSAPPSGETMHQTPKSFKGARTRLMSSITMPSFVGLGFHPPPGWPKTLSFLSLSGRHAFERDEFVAPFRHEDVGVQKRF